MGKSFNTGKLVNNLNVLDNGNVGIGVANPSTILDVVGAGGIRVNEDGAGTKVISIRSNFAGVDPAINVTTNNALLLQTNNTERMRITSTGNVGIGTSTPIGKFSAKLATATSVATIAASGWDSTYAIIGNPDATTGTSFGVGTNNSIAGINLLACAPASDWVDFNYYSRQHIFFGSGTERMRINSTGNVGIGTTSPVYKLVVSKAGAEGLEFDAGTIVSGKNYILSFNRSTIAYSDLEINANNMTFGAGSSERMRITSSGNVGIGTTNPSSIFQVATAQNISVFRSTTTTNYAEVQIENTTNYFQIGVEGATGNRMGGTIAYNAYLGSYANYGMTFHTNNLNRMSLSSNGTLSINGPRFIQQGLSRLCYAGSIGGNQSITITLNVGSQSAVKITAAMNHYGYISGYGCARMSWVGASPAFSEINISNVTSESGGSWSFTHGGGGVINIIKNAGSYGGGGYFFVEVIGNDPISIA